MLPLIVVTLRKTTINKVRTLIQSLKLTTEHTGLIKTKKCCGSSAYTLLHEKLKDDVCRVMFIGKHNWQHPMKPNSDYDKAGGGYYYEDQISKSNDIPRK